MTDGSMEVYYDLLKGWRINIDKRGYETIPAEVVEAIETRVKERIIKQLREKAVDLMRISESIDEDEYMNAGDNDAPYWGSFALNDFADALIKGEK